MIALFATICYWVFELLTPPSIRQIRYITRECVSKIMPPTRECVSKISLPTRDENGYPILGEDVVP